MENRIQLKMLDSLLDAFSDVDPEEAACKLLKERGEDKQSLGLLLRAAVRYQTGDFATALDELLSARQRFGFMPLAIIANIIWLCQRTHTAQPAACASFEFARDAFRMGYPDLGMEACTAAYILDGQATFELIRNPETLRETGHCYQQAAKAAGIQKAPKIPITSTSLPLNVAMVVPNLVDHVVAYTKRVLQFARYLNRAHFNLRVYVTENLSQREQPMFPYGCVDGASEVSGTFTLQALRQAGIPVILLPRNQSFSAAGKQLITYLEQHHTDIALFQSGMACGIDWLGMYGARIPIKAGIHIGTSYFGAGLDAMIIDNPQNLHRELNWDETEDGQRILIHKGTDLDLLDAQPAIPRSRLHVPDDAVIIGTLSNHLDERLSTPYLTLIADVMKRHHSVWFVPIGGGNLQSGMNIFQRKGVAHRVRPAGRQLQVGGALKLLDIYASEFPVGGSQSVIEAMACGLPVVAMRWSQAHAESIAAELAGTPYGIMSRNPEAYTKLLDLLVENAPVRRAAGQAMRSRAQRQFSAGNYVASVMQELLNIYAARTNK